MDDNQIVNAIIDVLIERTAKGQFEWNVTESGWCAEVGNGCTVHLWPVYPEVRLTQNGAAFPDFRVETYPTIQKLIDEVSIKFPRPKLDLEAFYKCLTE